ncbi:MAG: hypothetical protein JWM16_2133, partial [Verrucomicrobiales bacterium]|nr:hypothetical protein [Verrucomicrobiales bacterium]
EKCEFGLEGSCSIQLSYGRDLGRGQSAKAFQPNEIQPAGPNPVHLLEIISHEYLRTAR